MPKKVVLTPEEKKAKAAERKANKKIQAELKRKTIQYDRLSREIHYGRLAHKKHEKSWKQMLMKMAMPRMRLELECAWHNFERVLDSKDFTISLLMDELKHSDEQYMRSQRSHMDNIDDLIVLCYDQIADLRTSSQTVILDLYKAATYERTDNVNITKDNEEYLRTMLFMLQDQKKESEKNLRGEYQSKQEVEISRLQDICNKFTEELEEKFNKVWDDSIYFLKKHIENFSHSRIRYYQLSSQDEVMQNVIRSLWIKIKSCMDNIKTTKILFYEYCYDKNKKLDLLTGEVKHFEHIHKCIKRRLEEELQMDEKNLQLLTIKSNEIKKTLEKDEKKAENLLKLSQICRKFETLAELTLQFPTYDDPEILKGIVKERECIQCMPQMNLFWNRFARADGVRYQINEEKEYLKLRNAKYKKKLHAYCQCLTCEKMVEVEKVKKYSSPTLQLDRKYNASKHTITFA